MSLSKIEHIIVITMENRSFDHMFGYLALGGHASDGLRPSMSNKDAAGTDYPVRRLADTYFPCDPCHSWECVQQQVADGNAGFVRSFVASSTPPGPAMREPGLVMGYYDGAQLPTFDYLAQTFLVCDRYFCSLPGPTWPNRLYGVAGTSAGEKNNPKPEFFRRYGMPTIFDYMDKALPSRAKSARWGYFHSGPFGFALVFNQHLDDLLSGRVRKLGDFFTLASAGKLPAVSWVEPDYRTETKNSDHPEGDVRYGQEFVARIYNAVRHGGNNLWNKAMLIVTYDEHGGFFDHVDPTSVPAPSDEYLPHYGVRVPTLVISPWVAKGSVSHEVYDHASVLKTILKRFWPTAPLPAMTARVAAARDMGSLLTEASPRIDTQGIPVAPVSRAATRGPVRARELAAGHDRATDALMRATRPEAIDLARRDRVRVGRSEYQALAEAYAADLRDKGLPVVNDDAPEMGIASAAKRDRMGAAIPRSGPSRKSRPVSGRSKR